MPEPLLDEPFEVGRGTGSFRRYAKSLQPRLMTAERVAATALAGIEADRAVRPVGVLAHILWRAERFLPALADWGSTREDRLVAEGK